MPPIEVPDGSLFVGHGADAPGAPFFLPIDDLVTHAVILGKTGSGKTGLLVCLLEEVALRGVPSIILDVKGDLTNLLLAFPGASADELRPWVPEGESAEDHAARMRRELEASGVPLERVARLAAATRRTVYAPGKLDGGGFSVDVLPSFAPPREASEAARRQRASSVVGALLGALGIEADPMTDVRHVFLTEILLASWARGETLHLERCVASVQQPPFAKVGGMAVDDYISPAERTKLARALVGFQAQAARWLAGVPLDVPALLAGPPRTSVFYLRHLPDADRSFFATLLLEGLVGWMGQAGASSRLRALFAIDEARGTLPPHPANPPTKRPLATLLAQARAQGLGIVIATQHPVDLDYKALSNVGTWFLGGLRPRDLKRDLEAELADRGVDAARLQALAPRAFLATTRDGKATAVRSRWAQSYLRGPLELRDLARLRMDEPPGGTGAGTGTGPPARAHVAREPEPAPRALVREPEPAPRAREEPEPEPLATDRDLLNDAHPLATDPYAGAVEALRRTRVIMSDRLPQTLPVISQAWAGGKATWRPSVFATVVVSASDGGRPTGERTVMLAVPLVAREAAQLPWDRAVRLDRARLAPNAPSGMPELEEVPEFFFNHKAVEAIRQKAAETARARLGWVVHEAKAVGQVARDGESLADFRTRLARGARDERRRDEPALREDARAALLRALEGLRADAGAGAVRQDPGRGALALLLGASSPLDFVEKRATARETAAWVPPADAARRLERLLGALAAARDELARGAGGDGPAPVVRSRVVAVEDARVTEVGLLWTRKL